MMNLPNFDVRSPTMFLEARSANGIASIPEINVPLIAIAIVSNIAYGNPSTVVFVR